jgi:hypothetical protein
MREWFDEQRIEPSRFVYDSADERVVMYIDFKLAAAAQAFAKRFVGRAPTKPNGSDKPDYPVERVPGTHDSR